MKAKKQELDVDFIGGQTPLTTEEEKALSDFFKSKKLSTKKARNTKKVSGVKQSIRPTSGL
ncbi:hypothetical protein [Rufibacter sp. LB8]|uniref:hypothetical protein n=1 Tax=Rufibacter sp. LB8 TaxID=2777781 RepID=UPI00178C756C|nr:hypothetical protein [Rufibacter sp. LB8]